MGGKEVHRPVVVENILRTVPMMHVQIGNEDAPDAVLFCAYRAVIATLFKCTKPMPRPGLAWCPGGRTAQNAFFVRPPEYCVHRIHSHPLRLPARRLTILDSPRYRPVVFVEPSRRCPALPLQCNRAYGTSRSHLRSRAGEQFASHPERAPPARAPPSRHRIVRVSRGDRARSGAVCKSYPGQRSRHAPSLPDIANAPEADMPDWVVRLMAIAKRHPQLQRIRAETATANHLARAGAVNRRSIVAIAPVIGGPLPHIAGHIVQTVAVGRIHPDSHRAVHFRRAVVRALRLGASVPQGYSALA